MNQLKTAALLATLTALFMWAGQALGGQSGMMIALVFAAVMNVGSYWFSDRIVLKMYRAQPATEENAPELLRIVRNLAQQAGMPMPKTYLIPTDVPNAFATGRNPEHAAVAATAGILNLLSRDELEGVLAHELGHVKNRDTLVTTIAATLAGALSMLANMAMWAMMLGRGGGDRNDGGNPFAALLGVIIAPIAASLIQMAISRSREFGADRSGADLCGKPLALASALQKIDASVTRRPLRAGDPSTASLFIINPFSRQGLNRLFSTHPPTAERVARLEAMIGGSRV